MESCEPVSNTAGTNRKLTGLDGITSMEDLEKRFVHEEPAASNTVPPALCEPVPARTTDGFESDSGDSDIIAPVNSSRRRIIDDHDDNSDNKENAVAMEVHPSQVEELNHIMELDMENQPVLPTAPVDPTFDDQIPEPLLVPPLNADTASSADEAETQMSVGGDDASVSGENFDMESSSEDEDAPVTIEAEEERLLEKYNKALRLTRALKGFSRPDIHRFEKVCGRFQVVLATLDQTPVLSDRMKNLRFAVLKNLAFLHRDQNDYQKALDYLTLAAEYDYTDIVMIHEMGELAVKLDNFILAIQLFQDAVNADKTFWPSLDAVITLTYALNYYPACLSYCWTALQTESSHPRAIAFAQKLFLEDEDLRREWFDDFQAVSSFIGRTGRESHKKFIDEATNVKRRWWKSDQIGDNDPCLQLKHVQFPSLKEPSYTCLGQVIMEMIEHLDANKLWNASLIVEKFLEEEMDVEPSGSIVSVTDISTLSSSEFGTKSNSGTKSKPRRLDPIFLEFAEKRRSSRNKCGARNDEAEIREMLQKFLNEVFGPDTVIAVDDSVALVSSDINKSKPAFEPAKDLWKNAQEEAGDVRNFLKNANGMRIATMTRAFLQFLAERSDHKWPQSLGAAYLNLYCRIAHEEFFQPYESYEAEKNETGTRRVILFALTALELVVDNWMQLGKIDRKPRNFQKDLDYIAVWPHSEEFTEEKDRTMHIRILFLIYKWHNLRSSSDGMQFFLEETLKRINDDDVVQMPNLLHRNMITKKIILHLLGGKKTFGRLSELEFLHKHRRYPELAEISTELLNQVSTSVVATGEKILFTAAHAKYTLSALEQLGLFDRFLVSAESLTQNLLDQVVQVADDKDDDRALIRVGLLDISDSVLRLLIKKLVDVGQLPAATLKRWAISLLEVCILLVHTSDGSTRRPNTVSPWILLYYVLAAGENGTSAETVENHGDASTRYLEEVHTYLGDHGWCTAGDGAFLHIAVDRLLHELEQRAKETESQSEIPVADIEFDLEQCFHCLYGVSKSKNRYLRHHNAKQVELTLPKAVPLYKFFEPTNLPEFDGFRNDCISQETVAVFTKIRPLMKPNLPGVVSREDIQHFITNFDPFTEKPELPIVEVRSCEETAEISKNMFYLLADYYYKSGVNTQAMKLYLTDLCINPRRVDSWAGLALNKGAKVEEKLRSFNLKPDRQIFLEAKEAIQCFCISLKINPRSERLCIECGSLVYPLHSYLSRQLAQSAQFRIKQDQKAQLKQDINYLLRLAQKTFLMAEDCEDRDESWLSQYMLGKTYEKLEEEKPWKYLAQYVAAAECLHVEGALYPSKIAYYKTPHLAVEALEMYYRIFASSLKYIRRSTSTVSGLQALEFYISNTENGPFARQEVYNAETSPESGLFVAKRVMDTCVLDRLEISTITRENTEAWRLKLVHRCIAGLRVCLTRYPEHYKSLYRLAKLYYEYKPLKDLQKTKELLWGSATAWTERPYMPCAGLLQLRKPSLFFKGVWHIKCEEIQRQLSFASHMFRAISLLISVLAELRENLVLLQICQQLAKPPDHDSKRFLRVDDYFFLSEFALKSALLSVMNRVDDYETESCSTDVRVAFLKEVLKVWQTARKETVKTQIVTLADTMLGQAYLRIVDGLHKSRCPIPIPQAVVDRAVKFIQQMQFRLKSPAKPATVTINLSTGLPEQPDLEEAQCGPLESVVPAAEDVNKNETITEPSTAMPESTPETTALICGDEKMDFEDDLLDFGLGFNTANINLDFDDLEMMAPEADTVELKAP